ncbi:MAG TPA: tyrosine-type recombinase/integrase [Aquella sp.]|nr:tyrosine-type recombinase/integrase [Aquella sp.]
MIVNNLGFYITKYFSEYLPSNLGVSTNTIKSYRDAFVQFISFLETKYKMKSTKLSFYDITASSIEDFLFCLEKEKRISIATRNQRLAAIHSFFKYIQHKEPAYFNLCTSILSIEFKKTPSSTISYLSLDEIKILFSLPNKNIKQEYRDLTMLVILYDTGARVQELIDLKLQHIRLDSKPIVYLHGKGDKTRVVPIGNDTANIIKKYIIDNAITIPTDNLFKNKQQKPLTRAGVDYVLNKYIEIGRKQKPNLFQKTISPHCMRHSKAMHLLEAGVNLIYIRDFLGHASVTTTEIYAKTNPELKRKFLEESSISLGVISKYSKQDKEDLLQWLAKNI